MPSFDPLARLTEGDSSASDSVQFIVATDVESAVSLISQRVGERRILLVDLAPLPPVRGQIDRILDEMADVARSLWPAWYGILDWDAQSRLRPADRLESVLLSDPDQCPGVSLDWFRKTAALCKQGRMSRPSGYLPEVHVAQLATAIEPNPNQLAILLRLDQPPEDRARLLGLARATEWLARSTRALVALIVPESLEDAPELDGINSRLVRIEADPVGTTVDQPREQRRRFGPIIGHPHPLSPGEQKLARRLADDIVGPLFQFNQRVTTTRGSNYIVDLLWEAGKVVVEVDGYEYHSARLAFASDRHRDYELMLSGYHVLRLTHDEVMKDVDRALEKIRDVVRLRDDRSADASRTASP